jgi:hypothetical protein
VNGRQVQVVLGQVQVQLVLGQVQVQVQVVLGQVPRRNRAGTGSNRTGSHRAAGCGS